MIDQLFQEVAKQVDWDELSFSFVSRILIEQGLTLPSERFDFTLQNLAALN